MKVPLLSRLLTSLVLFSLGLFSLPACGSGGGELVCADTSCLNGALRDAKSGVTVKLEAGTYEGNFELSAGVSLSGAGEVTILSFSGDGPVLTVSAGAAQTTISNLTIEKSTCPYQENPNEVAGSGGGGILIEGDGEVWLSDLKVQVSCGIGIKVKGIAGLTGKNLTLIGNVTSTDEPGILTKPNRTKYAVAGLSLNAVGQADLEAIDANGFAGCGVLFHGTPGTLDGGELHDLVGSGVHASGSVMVTLKNLHIHDIWGGATPFGYGIAATNLVHLLTEDVILENNKVAGILMDHSTGEHINATVSGNGARGIWLQSCTPTQQTPDGRAVIVRGNKTKLINNNGVAFGVFQSTGISLADADVSGTQKISMIAYQESTRVDIGDGIEVIGSDDLEFSDLTVNNNQRAGIIIDAREGVSEVQVTFVNVTIDGDGERGFSVQHGTVTTLPDVIDNTLRENDAAGEILDVVSPLETDRVPSPFNIIDIPT
ncbi:MAG: right-handed parallel beta-helix repeat-containing protein [Deltaproteobacteria bacterium]|nr:right-handed parallel beta-helix repeat-containing protein [Deltaproteobacteria bacterium]